MTGYLSDEEHLASLLLPRDARELATVTANANTIRVVVHPAAGAVDPGHPRRHGAQRLLDLVDHLLEDVVEHEVVVPQRGQLAGGRAGGGGAARVERRAPQLPRSLVRRLARSASRIVTYVAPSRWLLRRRSRGRTSPSEPFRGTNRSS